MKKTEEKTNIICPNIACGKVFVKPLKSLKLHEGSKEQYNACPHCLTEIYTSQLENENPPEETVIGAPIFNEELNQKEEKTLSCKYHRGYLSEKDHKQQIPEDCMVCNVLIDCMHKK